MGDEGGAGGAPCAEHAAHRAVIRVARFADVVTTAPPLPLVARLRYRGDTVEDEQDAGSRVPQTASKPAGVTVTGQVVDAAGARRP